MFRLWSWSVDLPSFGVILTFVKRVEFSVSGHFPKNAWGNGMEFCRLMYPFHLQNWLHFSHGLLMLFFFSFWHYFDLVKQVEFGISRHFLENAWRNWPEILHADVSRTSSELIILWSWLLIFLLLASLWLRETGHIWGSGHCLENAWEKMLRGNGGIFLTLCVEFCLVLLYVIYCYWLHCRKQLVTFQYKCVIRHIGHDDYMDDNILVMFPSIKNISQFLIYPEPTAI